jgi:hypothetical protein
VGVGAFSGGAKHKCSEVLAALRAAGLYAKRVRSLSRRTWLLKIGAPQWRMEVEAERIRLRMRRRDGGWSRFKRSQRAAFALGAPDEGEEEERAKGRGWRGNAHRGGDAARGDVEEALPDPHCLDGDEGLGGTGGRESSGSGGGGGGDLLFHSSDRQTLIDHILRSGEREGGAGLGEGSELGAYVTHMFPLHMRARLTELRSDWLAIWRPTRSRGALDRVGAVDPAWYAASRLLDPNAAAPAAALAKAAGMLAPPEADAAVAGSSAPRLLLAAVATGQRGDKPGAGASTVEGDRGGAWCCAPDSCCCCCLSSRGVGLCLARCPRCLAAPLLCLLWLLWRLGRCCGRAARSTARCCSRPLSQPLDRIAAYFGEATAFYFAWLQYYTAWLALPAVAGVLVFLSQLYAGTLDVPWVPLYSLTLAVWSIVMLELWKRRNAELAVRWGVLNYEAEEVVRPQFAGQWRVDADTGTLVRVYPAWRRALTYAVTLPVILAFVLASVLLMVFVFSTRDHMLAQLGAYETALDSRAAAVAALAAQTNITALERAGLAAALPPVPSFSWDIGGSIAQAWEGGVHGFLQGVNSPAAAPAADAPAGSAADGTTAANAAALSLSWSAVGQRLVHWEEVLTSQHNWRWWVAMTLPPVVYGVAMPAIDALFSRVALAFNDWENHATESGYRNHRIAKVFFYRFSSSFVSLFYYSFSPSHASLATLFVQLATFLLVGQLFKRNVLGLGLARLRRACAECRAARRVRHAEDSGLTEGRRGRRLLRHATSGAWVEARMPPHDTFHDYAELLIQFGYVTFFSWAFPLGAAIALVNNLLEMRAGAYRLCFLTQRPVAHKAGGVGVWYSVLQGMALLAILTNTAHLALSSTQFRAFFPTLSDAQRLLLVFVMEHAVLALRTLLAFAIPPVPAGVRRRAARDAWNLARLQGRRSVGGELGGVMGDAASTVALGADAALAPAVPLAMAAAAAAGGGAKGGTPGKMASGAGLSHPATAGSSSAASSFLGLSSPGDSLRSITKTIAGSARRLMSPGKKA